MSQVRKFYRGGKGKVPVTINVNTGETPENNTAGYGVYSFSSI